MRLQLTLATWLAMGASLASAQDGEWRANADALIYTDADNVQAYSPQGGVERTIDEDGGAVGARVTIDVVSAASVDVVSQATPHYQETRAQGEVYGAKAFGGFLPRLGYTFSWEPDYISHTPILSLISELGTPDSVLNVAYGFSHDRISRAGSPRDAFSATLLTSTATLGLTQTLTPRLLVRGVYTFTAQWGYMEKIYRYVPLFTPSALAAAQETGGVGFDDFNDYRSPLRPPEEVPDRRRRHAFAFRGLYYLPAINASLRLDYQFYVDDWEMQAHIIEPGIRSIVRTHWEVGGWVRVYRQNAAYFWKRTYLTNEAEDELPALRTADRDLSPYTAMTFGGHLGWRSGGLHLYGEASVVETLYDDFLYRDSLTALVFQFGVEVRR